MDSIRTNRFEKESESSFNENYEIHYLALIFSRLTLQPRLECGLESDPQDIPLFSLPYELHFMITSYLLPNDRICLALTSKSNYQRQFDILPKFSLRHGVLCHFQTLKGIIHGKCCNDDDGDDSMSFSGNNKPSPTRHEDDEEPLWKRLEDWMGPKWEWTFQLPTKLSVKLDISYWKDRGGFVLAGCTINEE